MDNEIWKDIPGYEGYYQASTIGRIRSIDRVIIYIDGRKAIKKGKLRKTTLSKLGYERINLTIKGKQHQERVHRLVAKTFIPNPNMFNEINHIDSVRYNNSADNLEWCSRSRNIKHSFDYGGSRFRKSSIIYVDLIKGKATVFDSQVRASEYTGIKQGTISNILRGKRQQPVGAMFIMLEKEIR